MSRAARFFWVSAVTAVLCFVALAILSKGSLEPDGMVIFDSRLGGYDLVAAQTYLGALNSEQIALYLGTFRQLDTVFPLLLALALGGGLWLNTSSWGKGARLGMMALPLGYLALDLLENAAVARLLRAGSEVKETSVAMASGLTQSKWVVLAVLLLAVVFSWRQARKERLI